MLFGFPFRLANNFVIYSIQTIPFLLPFAIINPCHIIPSKNASKNLLHALQNQSLLLQWTVNPKTSKPSYHSPCSSCSPSFFSSVQPLSLPNPHPSHPSHSPQAHDGLWMLRGGEWSSPAGTGQLTWRLWWRRGSTNSPSRQYRSASHLWASIVWGLLGLLIFSLIRPWRPSPFGRPFCDLVWWRPPPASRPITRRSWILPCFKLFRSLSFSWEIFNCAWSAILVLVGLKLW